jgi:hypothetical protein
VSEHITCPTCLMSASKSDHRQLIPIEHHHDVEAADRDRRRCRNCGATIEIADGIVATLSDAQH